VARRRQRERESHDHDDDSSEPSVIVGEQEVFMRQRFFNSYKN
jgi:hypothetical protein